MADDLDLDAELLAQMRDDFLLESQEILERLGQELTQLEQAATPELINTIFRETHTLKGTAGFVGLESIRKVAHQMEDVFGAVRSGQLTVTPALIDTAFEGTRVLTALREDVAQGGSGEGEIGAILTRLEAALHGEPTPVAPKPTAPPPTSAPPLTPEPPPAETETRSTASSTESTLRVDVDTLDTLMTLVGEMITARNALQARADQLRDEPLLEDVVAVNRLTRQLQTAVTAIRLVPVERLFNRFTPIVRNLARELNKQVRLVIEGGETPLDRAVSEQMYDPLIHLVRNALDHGLESAEARRAAGKSREGTLTLSAERRGDNVMLRVTDDGHGIDPTRVRAVALERGLYSEQELNLLSDEQTLHLIFAPGFSTASTVTNLSGRGVGMDVVAQNVRRLRGQVTIETTLGQGTSFVIQLPLTLAILQVLLARVEDKTYALPLHTVRETLLLSPDAVQTLQHHAITFIRETALPVYRLSDWLRGESNAVGVPTTTLKPAVVARLARGETVLVVDELLGKQQMVIKPLNAYLGAVPGVEGAAILPDGSVTLILDMDGLVA